MFKRLAIVLCLADTCAAQVSVRVYSLTALSAGSKSVAANQDVTGGVNLWDGPGGSCRPSASLRIIVSNPSVRFSCSSSSQCSPAPSASGSIRIRLSATQATAGFIVVEADCPGSWSGFSVDVGNNGIDLQSNSQFKAQRLLESSLVVGPSGVDVIVHCYAGANAWPLSAGAEVTVRFVPGASTQHLKLVGTTCGPELASQFRQLAPFGVVRDFSLEVANATRTSSWFVIGLKEQGLTLPPAGCKLYTDIVMPLWAIVDSSGKSSLQLPVPNGVSQAQAYVQFVQATFRSNRMEWTTSQAVQLRL